MIKLARHSCRRIGLVVIVIAPTLIRCGTEVGNGDQINKEQQASDTVPDESRAQVRFTNFAVALASDCSAVTESMWAKTAYEVTLDGVSYDVEISGGEEKTLLFDGELVLIRRDGQVLDADERPVATDTAKCEKAQGAAPPSGDPSSSVTASQTITAADGSVTVAEALKAENGDLTQITATNQSGDSEMVMVAVD